MSGQKLMNKHKDYEKKVKEIVAIVFNLDPSEIGTNISPNTVENWDSLNHMKLVVAIEEEFGIELTDKEIGDLKDFLSIVECIENKLRTDENYCGKSQKSIH